MRTSILLALQLLLVSVAAKGHDSQSARRRHHQIIERDAQNVTESSHTLSKRAFTGTGTFFYVGLGACGQWSKDSDLMVALNSAQYGGGYPGPQCFKSITIQANGKTQVATIMDECPTCGYGSLDLSPTLFSNFIDPGAGVVPITWWFNDGSEAAPQKETTSEWVAPTSEWHAPTSTTPAWTPEPTSTSTYVWVAPSSSSTSQWVAPSSSSTSQWVAPSSSSTSQWVAPSSSSVASSAASSSSRAAFFQTASMNSTASASASGSVSASPSATSASAGGTSDTETTVGTASNLAALNVLAAQFGGLVVAAAEA